MRQELFCARNLSAKSELGSDLVNLNLTLYTGEILGLLTNRYDGKPTLFNIMLGKLPFQTGTIEWYGTSNSKQPLVIRVGIHSAIVDDLTIWENIAILWEHYDKKIHMNSSQLKKIIRIYLDDYNISFILNQKAKTLSQLDKLILEIVSLLRCKPALFIVDLGGIDGTTQEYLRLKALLQRLQEENITVMLSAYHAENISVITDRIAILHKGRILKTVSTWEFSPGQINQLVSHLYRIKQTESLPLAYKNEGVLEICGLKTTKNDRISIKLYANELVNIVSTQPDLIEKFAARILEGEQADTCKVLFRGKNVKMVRSGEIMFLGLNDLDEVIKEMTPLENLLIGVSGKITGIGTRRLMNVIEKDFVEWYGHEELMHYPNSAGLYRKHRIALNLFRLRLLRPSILFCVSPNANNDIVTYNMVMETLLWMVSQGTGICVLRSEFAEHTEQIGKYINLDELKDEDEGI